MGFIAIRDIDPGEMWVFAKNFLIRLNKFLTNNAVLLFLLL